MKEQKNHEDRHSHSPCREHKSIEKLMKSVIEKSASNKQIIDFLVIVYLER